MPGPAPVPPGAVLAAILEMRGCEHPILQVRERQGKEVHTILSQSLVSEPALQAAWERPLGEQEGPQSTCLSQDPRRERVNQGTGFPHPEGLHMGSSHPLKARQGEGHPTMRA